jgi:hypothetical protein
MAANSTNEASPQKYLAEAVKRFSRSIELCDDYLRGYYGLKKVKKLEVSYLGTLVDDIIGHRQNLGRWREV